MSRGWLAAALVAILACAAAPAGLERTEGPAFRGPIRDGGQISAVVRFGTMLIIAADERAELQILDRSPAGATYEVRPEPISLLAGEKEADIEGLARDGNLIYALGSHSLKRKKLKPGAGQADNRKRIAKVVADPGRDNVFRVELDPENGRQRGEVQRINLREIFERDPVLAPFSHVPGKENGVDIEGIASDGKRLWLGLRTPVLRSGHAPVLVLAFDDPSNYEMRFVDLGGGGIRDMTRAAEGFLILAGPSGPGDSSFRLYAWDGSDLITGNDRPADALTLLGNVPCPEGARAEGVTVMRETPQQFELLIVYDGAPDGAPRTFRLRK